MDFARSVHLHQLHRPRRCRQPGRVDGTALFFAHRSLVLLQVVYTITGFDASGHTSEETRDAAAHVPKGMILRSSGRRVRLHHGLRVRAGHAGRRGRCRSRAGRSSPTMLEAVGMPAFLKNFRHRRHRGVELPVRAGRLDVLLAHDLRVLARRRRALGFEVAAQGQPEVPHARQRDLGRRACLFGPCHARYGARAYVVLSTGCAVFLYVSYAMPIGAGILAEGKTWTKKGPFDLGGASKLVALLAVIGCIDPGVRWRPAAQREGRPVSGGASSLLIVVWLAFEKNRFPGPPLTEEAVKARQAEIAREEAALGGAG